MKPLSRSSLFVSLSLHIAGFLLCILPPAVCTLNYFPFWKELGYESCIAGGTALLITICAIPLFKLLKRAFTSYSSGFLWLILFLLFFSLSKIAEQMTVISLVGFIGNLMGAICFHFARRINERRKKND